MGGKWEPELLGPCLPLRTLASILSTMGTHWVNKAHDGPSSEGSCGCCVIIDCRGGARAGAGRAAGSYCN